MGTRKSRYSGATASDAKKVKKWKYIDTAYTIGDQLRLLEELESKGYIIKVKPIYKASMIYVNFDKYLELHPEKLERYKKAGVV